jgi:hypothetical protein
MTRTNIRTLAQIGIEIKGLEKRTIASVVEIGRLLAQASELCEHGEYGAWLETNFAWSSKTAYRYIAVHTIVQNCHTDNFADLNLSLSVVYLLAEYGPDSPYTKAIIKAAQKGRVGYRTAQAIIDEVEAEQNPKPSPPVELLSDEVKPLEAEKPELEVDEVPPPSSDVDVKDDWQDWLAEKSTDEPVELLQRLDVMLRDQHSRDWAKVIKAVSPMKVREIVDGLKAALDRYNLDKAIKAKADRAEAAASRGVEPVHMRI